MLTLSLMGRFFPRTHPRYKIDSVLPMQIEIPVGRGQTKHTLHTMGLGGFGFFGHSKLAELLRKGPVPMFMLIGNKRVEILGRARYCQFLPNAVKDAPYFIGIQYEALNPEVQFFLKSLIQAAVVKGHMKTASSG